MYDNPDNYTNEEKRKLKMLSKAIEYMEKKKSDKEEIEMDADDIVTAAKKFDYFVKEK